MSIADSLLGEQYLQLTRNYKLFTEPVDGSRTLRGSDSERQGHGTAVCGETRTTNNEKTMIYCKDSVTPAGPLALHHARIHYSIHPPPNGNVRVPKTSYEISYEISQISIQSPLISNLLDSVREQAKWHRMCSATHGCVLESPQIIPERLRYFL